MDRDNAALLDSIEDFMDALDRHYHLMRHRAKDPNYGGADAYQESRDRIKEALLDVLQAYEDSPL